MSEELSYAEALAGIVSEDEMEAMLGLLDSHKAWGAFRAKIPTHIIVNLVDEVRKLRSKVGGYKSIPTMDMGDLDAFDESD